MNLLETVRSQASAEYADFLSQQSESTNVGDYILLYGQADLPERNATYEVQTYLPGWFTIGDDGGGKALLMRLDGSAAVFQCGHGAIGSIEPELVSDTFSKWLESGCPAQWMDDDDDY